jgi:diphosphomevalonate decarboxylase
VIRAIAHPNIALSKYWGKRAGDGNVPAVPSLSVTLDGVATTTSLTLEDDLREDRFVLDGEPQTGPERARVSRLLDRVRAASVAAGMRPRFAVVESSNDFPTAAGLASSASGFAALAVAAVRAFGLDWSAERVADLARRSSASAARSIFGGFVELEGETTRVTAQTDHLPLKVLVCVTTESKKELSSTEGMIRTTDTSPYYAAWLESAPKLHARVKNALLSRDFEALGNAAEASALAMHACAMSAGVMYFNGVTVEAMRSVRALRDKGTPAFFTVDAGPHVKVLVRPEDASLAATWMRAVPGVLRVLECGVGEGAKVIS